MAWIKHIFRNIGLYVLGLLLIGIVVLGLYKLPVWLEILIGVPSLILVFFFILVGRDFFENYLTKSLVTVVGFTITITRLQESHTRISNYERLLIRVERFLRVTLRDARAPFCYIDKIERLVIKRFVRRDSEEDQEGLKILCTVPTLGNMSHPSLYLTRLHPIWIEIAQCFNLSVEIVCIDGSVNSTRYHWMDLIPAEERGRVQYSREDFDADNEFNRRRKAVRDSTSIGKFYKQSFSGFKDSEILEGMVQAVEIVNRLHDARQGNRIIPYQWPPNLGNQPPIHLFWTRKRAIVAVPLDRNIQRQNANRVTMIGYETTSTDVIERLLEVYNEWRSIFINSTSGGTQTNPSTEEEGK